MYRMVDRRGDHCVKVNFKMEQIVGRIRIIINKRI
jgi:hypothetical protein